MRTGGQGLGGGSGLEAQHRADLIRAAVGVEPCGWLSGCGWMLHAVRVGGGHDVFVEFLAFLSLKMRCTSRSAARV